MSQKRKVTLYFNASMLAETQKEVDELDRMGRLVEDMTVLVRSEDPEFLRPEEVDLHDFAADASQANDAQGLAGQLAADELAAFPFASMHAGVGRGRVPRKG